MEIRLITNDSLNTVWQEKFDTVCNVKLTVFSFNGLGLVSYKKELSGETEYFRDVATFSKQTDGVVICGCDTDTYGVFRHSAVIADNGNGRSRYRVVIFHVSAGSCSNLGGNTG